MSAVCLGSESHEHKTTLLHILLPKYLFGFQSPHVRAVPAAFSNLLFWCSHVGVTINSATIMAYAMNITGPMQTESSPPTYVPQSQRSISYETNVYRGAKEPLPSNTYNYAAKQSMNMNQQGVPSTVTISMELFEKLSMRAESGSTGVPSNRTYGNPTPL